MGEGDRDLGLGRARQGHQRRGRQRGGAQRGQGGRGDQGDQRALQRPDGGQDRRGQALAQVECVLVARPLVLREPAEALRRVSYSRTRALTYNYSSVLTLKKK